MKSLQHHINESINENYKAKLESALKNHSATSRLPTSGSKIKSLKSAENSIYDVLNSMSIEELLTEYKLSGNGSAKQLYIAKELTEKAYEKLQNDANKNRQGVVGNVNSINHAIEILTSK